MMTLSKQGMIQLKESEHLTFSVDSQLLGEIGEKLVTNNYIALSELVKNGYDADATDVYIELFDTVSDYASPDSEIRITDNGSGMTFEQVEEFWMTIATPNKSRNPTSMDYGRQKTGNKGIGRFACQKLARHLRFETVAKLSNAKFEYTAVDFEWDKFIPGTELTKIPCSYNTHIEAEGKTGLTLRLMDLKERWTVRDFKMLQKNIAILSISQPTRRTGFKEDPGFSIRIRSEEFGETSNPLGPKFLHAGWGTINGSINRKGKIKLKLTAKDSKIVNYVLPSQYSNLSGISFEFNFLPQNRPEHLRDKTLLTKRVLTDLLETQSGIKIYMDNFRIYPYGEPPNDWLELDYDYARRRASTSKLLDELATKLNVDSGRAGLSSPRNANIIGKVQIFNQAASGFVIKMDREGLIENQQFADLRECLKLSIDWMTLHYRHFHLRLTEQKHEASQENFTQLFDADEIYEETNVKNAINFLRNEAAHNKIDWQETDAPLALKIAAKVEKQIVEATNLIDTKIKKDGSELTLMRTIASVGPLIFVFAHEVKGITSALDTHAAYLRKVSSELANPYKTELLSIADSFKRTRKRFNQLDNLFNVFSSSHSMENKRIPVSKTINNITEGFGFVLGEFNISIFCDEIDRTLKTKPMREAEFYAIMVNIMSNAIKSSIAGTGKEIIVTAERNPKSSNLIIRVSDKGVGLRSTYWEDVFEPLITDPENKIYKSLPLKFSTVELQTLGRGTGLGLGIVRNIANSYKGSARFIKPNKGWKACLEISLP